MNQCVVGIREKGSDVVRQCYITDSVEHFKRELCFVLSDKKCSPAYYNFPDDYELVVMPIDNKAFDTVCVLSDLMIKKEKETNENPID